MSNGPDFLNPLLPAVDNKQQSFADQEIKEPARHFRYCW